MRMCCRGWLPRLILLKILKRDRTASYCAADWNMLLLKEQVKVRERMDTEIYYNGTILTMEEPLYRCV